MLRTVGYRVELPYGGCHEVWLALELEGGRVLVTHQGSPYGLGVPRGFELTAESSWGRALTAEEAASVAALLDRIAIRFPSEDIGGLDGQFYRLTYSCGMHSAELTWWCEIPPEWVELRPLVEALAAYQHPVVREMDQRCIP
jgi:hypothetical protein